MNPPSQDFKDILVDASIGTFGTDIFIGKEPDSPNACVTLYDTGGFPPQVNNKLDYPTVQVRIRGEVRGYQNAYAKAENIKDALHAQGNITQGSTKYSIWCMSDILFIGYDDKDRPLFTVNFRTMRAPV
ncbi:MAG: minor capsid protein [Candidatus Heimdallarchaeaceae archaeon]